MFRNLAASALLGLTTTCFADSEVVTREPTYNGVRAMVPVPADYHLKNEGGSDEAGLCVITSNTSDGWYQGVPEFVDAKGSKVWRLAKAAPGGYYPAKLEDLFTEAGVRTPWIQAEGSAEELMPVIRHYLGLGVPTAVTMSWGDRYGQAIHHMVQAIHLDDSLACIVDNNFPGEYFWMTADEFARRLVDGRAGWIVVLLRGVGGVAVVVLIAAGLATAAGVAFAAAGAAIVVLAG